MLSGILASPVAPQFLAAFNCDPFTGVMQIPVVNFDPTDREDCSVSSVTLTEHSSYNGWALGEQLEQATHSLTASSRVVIPQTADTWFIEKIPMHIGNRIELSHSKDDKKWNAIEYKRSSIDKSQMLRALDYLQRGSDTSDNEASWGRIKDEFGISTSSWRLSFSKENTYFRHSMLISGSIRRRKTHCDINYSASFSDLGLVGLKHLLRLPDNSPPEIIRSVLAATLNLQSMSKETVFNDEIPALGGIDELDNFINIRIDEEGLRITAESTELDSMVALPKSLHHIWKLGMSLGPSSA